MYTTVQPACIAALKHVDVPVLPLAVLKSLILGLLWQVPPSRNQSTTGHKTSNMSAHRLSAWHLTTIYNAQHLVSQSGVRLQL